MRIGIIAPPWVAVPPSAYGGTEAVLDQLARGLAGRGHDVLLHTTGDSTCPVERSSVLPHAVGTASTASALEIQHVIHGYDSMRAWGAQIVHDHTLVGPLYTGGTVPVVTTNHGPFDGPLADLYRAVGNRTPVIAISGNQAATAGGVPVATVIHHGVDVHSFPFGPTPGAYALFLGRMNPDKGVDVAIRVARAARVPLVIAAKMVETAEREYFAREIEPLLGHEVTYVGEVGGSRKLELLANAMCLLNPIQWPEPFGMVMIEALACGTPVVATPCGAVPEIVIDGRTGFVRATEPDLVEALHQVSSLSRFDCRHDAARRFSTARMVDDHLRFYERVVAQHPAEALAA